MTLLELAEACERANGADGLLDVAIGKAVGAMTCGDGWGALPYTASLDAAISLVPEGKPWSVNDPANADGSRSIFGYSSRCYAYVEGGDRIHNYGKTPALSLCAAALRARHAIAMEGGDD